MIGEAPEIPEADRTASAPHPRFATRVIGHDTAETEVIRAIASGKLHHAWMLTGPKGIGKATLAWRIAKHLLTHPIGRGAVATLDPVDGHAALPRLAALSEPRLFLLRRPWDEKASRLRAEIPVDEVRKLKAHFSLSAADGGRRVVIVDAAEDMNPNAANAILKVLEEPPPDTVMLLICHQPSRLLPTIRSRCRVLRCHALSSDAMAQVFETIGIDRQDDIAAISDLSGGSVGSALRLLEEDGLALYRTLLSLFENGLDRPGALALADSLTGRKQAAQFDLVLDLFDLMLARLAKTGLGQSLPGAITNEHALFARISRNPTEARGWAELHQEISARARHGQAVNLDPAALILDIVFKIHRTAAAHAA